MNMANNAAGRSPPNLARQFDAAPENGYGAAQTQETCTADAFGGTIAALLILFEPPVPVTRVTMTVTDLSPRNAREPDLVSLKSDPIPAEVPMDVQLESNALSDFFPCLNNDVQLASGIIRTEALVLMFQPLEWRHPKQSPVLDSEEMERFSVEVENMMNGRKEGHKEEVVGLERVQWSPLSMSTGEGILFVEAEAEIALEQLGDAPQPPFLYFDKLFYGVPAYGVETS
ncbi:hypothetical protein MRB53_018522 [Persea americana]|uniref:Uncharacterized protein n=1 Tax=Persea americana TaxID=3435 RepID=A0ACC2M8C8_PERAE|nr:hypothetical protein MRB53_018522 [Persea americana]